MNERISDEEIVNRIREGDHELYEIDGRIALEGRSDAGCLTILC